MSTFHEAVVKLQALVAARREPSERVEPLRVLTTSRPHEPRLRAAEVLHQERP